MSGIFLALLEPLLEAAFSAIGKSFTDWLATRRAEQAQRDVGRLTSERDQAKLSQAATQAELEAAVNAPRSADDAAARLEEGSA